MSDNLYPRKVLDSSNKYLEQNQASIGRDELKNEKRKVLKLDI